MRTWLIAISLFAFALSCGGDSGSRPRKSSPPEEASVDTGEAENASTSNECDEGQRRYPGYPYCAPAFPVEDFEAWKVVGDNGGILEVGATEEHSGYKIIIYPESLPAEKFFHLVISPANASNITTPKGDFIGSAHGTVFRAIDVEKPYLDNGEFNAASLSPGRGAYIFFKEGFFYQGDVLYDAGDGEIKAPERSVTDFYSVREGLEVHNAPLGFYYLVPPYQCRIGDVTGIEDWCAGYGRY